MIQGFQIEPVPLNLAGKNPELCTLRPEGAAVGTVLVGIGVGPEVDLIAFLLSRYLGMRSFGEIYGYLFSIFMLGAGLGPFATGVSYDRTGSYHLMLVCFACALALASLPILRLGAYAYPTIPNELQGGEIPTSPETNNSPIPPRTPPPRLPTARTSLPPLSQPASPTPSPTPHPSPGPTPSPSCSGAPSRPE